MESIVVENEPTAKFETYEMKGARSHANGNYKKRLWIPVVGWTLCYGIFHNCVVVPFFGFPAVEWEYLLAGLGILLGVSGVRDIGLRKGQKDVQDD